MALVKQSILDTLGLLYESQQITDIKAEYDGTGGWISLIISGDFKSENFVYEGIDEDEFRNVLAGKIKDIVVAWQEETAEIRLEEERQELFEKVTEQ